jgi:hypothetical protein
VLAAVDRGLPCVPLEHDSVYTKCGPHQVAAPDGMTFGLRTQENQRGYGVNRNPLIYWLRGLDLNQRPWVMSGNPAPTATKRIQRNPMIAAT